MSFDLRIVITPLVFSNLTKPVIDLGNTDIFWKRMVDLYAAFIESFSFPIDQTVSEEISFLCLTDKKLYFFLAVMLVDKSEQSGVYF